MEEGDKLTPRLRCDMKLELAGPNVPTLNKQAADALRTLADRLEGDQFQDGLNDVIDGNGKKVGTIYVDYLEGDF